MNFNAVPGTAFKKPKKLLTILSICFMTSLVVFLASPTANAVDTLYISSSVDESSITQVGDSYRPFVISTTVNGGSSPFTLSFYYRTLGNSEWIQSGTPIELETVNNQPISDYQREVYIMNSGKYQIMVHCIDSDLHTDTYILNVEVNRIATPTPDWLIGSDKISIPDISFEVSDFTVNSEGIGIFTSSFSSFVPSEFIAILPAVVLLLFVGWWLRK